MTVEEELPTLQPRSARSWHFKRLVPLLIRPRATLARIVEEDRPSWRAPILLLLLATIAQALLTGSINAAARAGGEVVLPPNSEFWTPEQQAQFLQAATATNNPTFNTSCPRWGRCGCAADVAGGQLAAAPGVDAARRRGTSQGAINVVAWASLPFVVRAVVQIVAMLLTDSVVAGGGLSGFAPAARGRSTSFWPPSWAKSTCASSGTSSWSTWARLSSGCRAARRGWPFSSCLRWSWRAPLPDVVLAALAT
jgi:hypothetical protein